MGNKKLRLYSHLVRLQLLRMSNRDYVVIMTPKVDDWLYVCTSCCHLLLCCPYTNVILLIIYICTCYCYDWAPLLRVCIQDLNLFPMMSTNRGHIQIPIWPFHIIYAFKLVIHYSRKVILYYNRIRIMHGLIRDDIQIYIQLIWVPMRLFQPYVPLHSTIIFFIMGTRVQGISWDPDLGLIIRDLFQTWHLILHLIPFSNSRYTYYHSGPYFTGGPIHWAGYYYWTWHHSLQMSYGQVILHHHHWFISVGHSLQPSSSDMDIILLHHRLQMAVTCCFSSFS